MSDKDRDGVSKSVGACAVSLALISRGVGDTKTICDRLTEKIMWRPRTQFLGRTVHLL